MAQVILRKMLSRFFLNKLTGTLVWDAPDGVLGSDEENIGKEISLIDLENATYIIQFYDHSKQKPGPIYGSRRLVVQK